MEKSLENADWDKRLIWAFLSSVLDTDWGDILSREPKISEREVTSSVEEEARG